MPRIVEVLVVLAVRDVRKSMDARQIEIARLVVGTAPHQITESACQCRNLVCGEIADVLSDPPCWTVLRLLQRRRTDGKPVGHPIQERLIALSAPCSPGLWWRHRSVWRSGELQDAVGVVLEALIGTQVMSPAGHVDQVLLDKEMPDVLEIGRIVDDRLGHRIPPSSVTCTIRRLPGEQPSSSFPAHLSPKS